MSVELRVAIAAVFNVYPYSEATRDSHWRSVERIRVSRILRVESNLAERRYNAFRFKQDTVVFKLNRGVLCPELS